MVDVDKAVIAKYRKDGKDFEILVDCDAALELKRGKNVDITSIIATDGIFKDVKKGLHASEQDVEKIFGTTNLYEVSKQIIIKGEVQVTTKHKDAEREAKRKQIITLIHRNAIDPKTGLPHPPQRIEAAIEQAKIGINEHKSAEEQIEEIVQKLRPIIPIKFEVKNIEVVLPAQYAGQCYGVLKKYKLKEDSWLTDGSLKALVEVPAGLQEEFFGALNKICHGDLQSKIMESKGE
ncbi:MAG: ribosome assembly factor SBDS [Candidatus Nanoarchaeia archaeon]|nr:ribosome assembly factor SBDS [Candidatus Nanoarchaeia archaeon]